MDNLTAREVTESELNEYKDNLIDPRNKLELMKNVDEDITFEEDKDTEFIDLDEII